MSVEFKTPYEIIEDLVETVEKTRKKKNLRQKDLSESSGVPLSSYQHFLYKKNISLEGLVKIFYALDMTENIKGMIQFHETPTLNDIRAKQKNKQVPKRIDKKRKKKDEK